MNLLHISSIVLRAFYNNINLGPPSETTFRFPIIIILITIGVAIGSGIGSIVALKRHQTRRRVLTFLYIALVAGLLFVPALIASKIVVTADHLEETIGFWPFASANYLAYHEIEYIRVGSDVVDGSPKRIWHVRDINGQWRHIQLSNLWELHELAIKTRLQQYGVAFRE